MAKKKSAPKKEEIVETTEAPKRKRGRPRKETTETPAPAPATPKKKAVAKKKATTKKKSTNKKKTATKKRSGPSGGGGRVARSQNEVSIDDFIVKPKEGIKSKIRTRSNKVGTTKHVNLFVDKGTLFPEQSVKKNPNAFDNKPRSSSPRPKTTTIVDMVCRICHKTKKVKSSELPGKIGKEVPNWRCNDCY